MTDNNMIIEKWSTLKAKRNMPAYKVGRLWKFKLSEVDAWIRSGGAADDNSNEDEE